MRKSEIRKHYFKDDFVIIAPSRANRPDKISSNTSKNDVGRCPFCPDYLFDSKITARINNRENDWEVISILNKYPSLTLDNDSAYGQAEVVIETRKHGMNINDFSAEHIAKVFDVYIERYQNLKKIDGIKHVIIFKNQGGKAGTSIDHTHSQIIALPLVPKKVRDEIYDFSKYRLEHDSCPYCDIIHLESKEKERIIWQDDNIFALSPYASDSPFGVWIIPKRHINSIIDLDYKEKISIGEAYRLILGKLDEYSISYNYFIDNSVNDEDYHMNIKLMPRPNIWAGLELGTGLIVNPITPEFAVEFYNGKEEFDEKAKL